MSARHAAAGRWRRARLAGLVLAAAGIPAVAPAAITVFPNPTQSQASQAEAVERERDAREPGASGASSPSTPPAAPASEPYGLPQLPHDVQRPLPGRSPAGAAVEAASAPAAASAAVADTIVPRALGLTLGDRFVHRVALPAEPVEAAELLRRWPVGRSGPWLDRQTVEVVTRPEGGLELRIGYQVVNAPTDPEVARLEGGSVPLRNGQSVVLPAADYTLVPATATRAATVTALIAELRPDHAPAAPTVDRARRRTLQAAALSLALALAALLSMQALRRHAARHRPLARAAATVEALARRGQGDAPEAWIALHRGLDTVAGRSLDARHLEALLARWPALAGERERLEQFFAASSARFFREDAVQPPFDLPGFARRLRAVERTQD